MEVQKETMGSLLQPLLLIIIITLYAAQKKQAEGLIDQFQLLRH